MEQTSHHPPRSHFLIEGPNDSYKFTGWYEFSITSGMTSSKVVPKGYNKVEFKDGQTIIFGHHSDLFFNILKGPISHQIVGKREYVDEKN